MTYEIDENLRRALIEYLAVRPWREVANFMPGLLTAQAIRGAGEGTAGLDAPAKPEKG